MAEEKPIAEVIHFYNKISVAILKIEKGCKIKVGDTVKFKGGDTEFEQEIAEMQLFKEAIEEAKAGQEVGVKVDQNVREGYKVFKA